MYISGIGISLVRLHLQCKFVFFAYLGEGELVGHSIVMVLVDYIRDYLSHVGVPVFYVEKIINTIFLQMFDFAGNKKTDFFLGLWGGECRSVWLALPVNSHSYGRGGGYQPFHGNGSG